MKTTYQTHCRVVILHRASSILHALWAPNVFVFLFLKESFISLGFLIRKPKQGCIAYKKDAAVTVCASRYRIP